MHDKSRNDGDKSGAGLGVYGVEGINLFCSSTEEIAEMVRFYTERVGLPLFLPYQPGQTWAAVSTGGVKESTCLWFVLRPADFVKGAEQQPGHVALSVIDLEAACAKLEGHVRWAAPIGRWDLPQDTYYRFRRFFDPAGNLMFLIEGHDRKSPLGVGGDGYRPAEVHLGPRAEQ